MLEGYGNPKTHSNNQLDRPDGDSYSGYMEAAHPARRERKGRIMYSEALKEKLWKAFLADGLASHYVDFEPWCRIRNIALKIISAHKD